MSRNSHVQYVHSRGYVPRDHESVLRALYVYLPSVHDCRASANDPGIGI